MAEGEHRFIDRVLAGVSALGITAEGTRVRLALSGAEAVERTVATYGPGDVSGLDAAAVTRYEPPAGSTGFEPSLFPAIELTHPALPWLAAPASTQSPWLVLVVLEDRPGVTLASTPLGRVLTLDAPARITRELPDLAQAWAWVHAYGTGTTGGAIDPDELAASARPTCARFVCPRRLAPRTHYHAALVPAYAAGVRAGLGETPVASDGDAPAWTATTALPLRLPAYAAWSFTTGDGGDFASLARDLVGRLLDPAGGSRIVDAADPGWTMTPIANRTVELGGLLRPSSEPILQTADAIALGEEIADLVDEASAPPPNEAPLLAPPAYGSSATGAESTARAPAWQAEITRDVSLRTAAGLGAEIVRRRQDELVDEAWRQLGDAEEANRSIRFAALSAAVSRRMFERHVAPLADTGVLQISAPGHRRLKLGTASTLAREVAASALPARSTSAAFRRQLRPGGKLARALGTAGTRARISLVERTNRTVRAPDRIVLVPPKAVPSGMATFDAISKDVNLEMRFASARTETVVANAAHWRTRVRGVFTRPLRALARERGERAELRGRAELLARPRVDPLDEPVLPTLPSHGTVTRATIDAFALAARRHQQYLIDHLAAVPRPGPRPIFEVLAGVRATMHADVASAKTLVAALDGRITGATITNAFQPISVAPVFERPLIDDVKAIGLDRLMPGLPDVLPNTVAVCVPDHDAIRAVIVGANHELSGELAWRRYPGPVDRLLLRTFWGRVVRDASGRYVRDPDVPQIDAWPDAGPPPPPVGIAVVIRGELLARYPNAIVYLVEAAWTGAFRVVGTGVQHHPSVRIGLGIDTALFAFAHDEATVRGGDTPSGPPGFYVVIEEAPHEPRFGLAATATGTDLAWSHVIGDDLHGEHLRTDGPLKSRTFDAGLRWGQDGAQQAAITLRRPTRVAIHAARLLERRP